jgi:hypothetical protein
MKYWKLDFSQQMDIMMTQMSQCILMTMSGKKKWEDKPKQRRR